MTRSFRHKMPNTHHDPDVEDASFIYFQNNLDLRPKLWGQVGVRYSRCEVLTVDPSGLFTISSLIHLFTTLYPSHWTNCLTGSTSKQGSAWR
jgi:hypothetical protein